MSSSSVADNPEQPGVGLWIIGRSMPIGNPVGREITGPEAWGAFAAEIGEFAFADETGQMVGRIAGASCGLNEC
jgi:hypothetical protein